MNHNPHPSNSLYPINPFQSQNLLQRRRDALQNVTEREKLEILSKKEKKLNTDLPKLQDQPKLIDSLFEVTTSLLHNLTFRLTKLPELLKLEPDVSMKGIMNQLLTQYQDKFPVNEMELSCSSRSCEQTSPLQILFYNSHSKFETGLPRKEHYISVKFFRILICPVAYVIRSDFSQNPSYLTTFEFRGKLPNGDWITLDERENIYQLSSPGAILVIPLHTNFFFYEFRLVQTGACQSGVYKFSIAGFDIHGIVKNQ